MKKGFAAVTPGPGGRPSNDRIQQHRTGRENRGRHQEWLAYAHIDEHGFLLPAHDGSVGHDASVLRGVVSALGFGLAGEAGQPSRYIRHRPLETGKGGLACTESVKDHANAADRAHVPELNGGAGHFICGYPAGGEFVADPVVGFWQAVEQRPVVDGINERAGP